MNNLRVTAYSSGTTTVIDPLGELENAEGLRFSTGYPGGLYLGASMFVPRDMARSWLVKGAQRLVIRNGLTPVFEGKIGDLDRALQRDTEGIQIDALGYWGAYLKSRRIRKRWADTRLHESVWLYENVVGGIAQSVDLCLVDRTAADTGTPRLRFVPKNEAWANGNGVTLRYTMPTGETVKRVKLTYDFAEAAQAWELRLWNVTTGAAIWSVTATGTAARDDTLATPSQEIYLQLISRAAQTPPSDGTIYGEVTGLEVYSETGAIDLTEISKDVQGLLTDLSADTFEIDSNTLSLVPFIADRFPTAADILIKAASYGDSSQNRWAVGILASELSTDDKPLLFVEQYPAITDYDYAVRIDEPRLEPPFDISEGYIGSDENNVWNWIIVQYRDEQGFTQYVTPDDDANLKDTDSITDWGQRDYLLKIRHGDVTAATNFGRRFLAAHKDPVWYMTRPIKMKGSIRAKSGNLVPCSEIRAGKRIRVENFLRDPALGTDDLIFIVTKTDYVDATEICTITTGRPNSLDVILAQQALEMERIT